MNRFDIYKAMYRRNNFGQPTVWYARPLVDQIAVYHGIVGKVITSEIINTNRNVYEEVKSRFNAKRKAGYKYLNELKDNTTMPVEGELLSYLNSYLPEYRTTSDGSVLPMLAKTYEDKIFKKCNGFIGQWKINGLRCFISAKSNNDMFKPIKLIFQSREGVYWNSLDNLEEYLLSVLDQKLLTKMIDEHYILDGEVYLPGYAVNDINHFVKDATCKENSRLQYWCYDVAIDSMLQSARLEILRDLTYGKKIGFSSKEEHLNNEDRLVILPCTDINNDENATYCRDRAIDLGFEGLILRNPNAEYQYGKRNSSMIKYKKSTDGKFLIVDIRPEGFKRPDIPIFICKNDINDSTFECHVGGQHNYQKQCLINKDKIIGKYMYIEYGERSGVNQFPFHIKHTYIME